MAGSDQVTTAILLFLGIRSRRKIDVMGVHSKINRIERTSYYPPEHSQSLRRAGDPGGRS
jgi:hypothetical protein